MATGRPGYQTVVFDLFFTLVHPGRYPGGTGRSGRMASLMNVDTRVVAQRWASFESRLESGRAPLGRHGLGPELSWVCDLAVELGVSVDDETLDRIDADWDFTRRRALLNPPQSTIRTLQALRERGIGVGVLSNTHALEVRAWDKSPIEPLVDAVAMSHEIGALKPDPVTYSTVLARLGADAASSIYVGDGSSDELAGTRAAGFGLVVLTEQAPVPKPVLVAEWA